MYNAYHALGGFNPRPLCRERPRCGITRLCAILFQSTPPMQGATKRGSSLLDPQHRFNPRPLCRERHRERLERKSIHLSFNPRPLCRERPENPTRESLCLEVSIHAPYAGSDPVRICPEPQTRCFNPRPLCRERPLQSCFTKFGSRFQSTPPMQGATQRRFCCDTCCDVSIHAPYAGSDQPTLPVKPYLLCFNPRPLCRERQK